uniref:Uncharacterized protein n=1 Tax=Alexandrium catenella TaxID=2925 RepID=A0A7S1M357_ALECA|mmetsp:Transcript_19030/g.51736  ORF Transcript_19030/g.51736 Transcript_19030/m.51736 type:complete len:159 (+) Transcript_19030:116-592(+)
MAWRAASAALLVLGFTWRPCLAAAEEASSGVFVKATTHQDTQGAATQRSVVVQQSKAKSRPGRTFAVQQAEQQQPEPGSLVKRFFRFRPPEHVRRSRGPLAGRGLTAKSSEINVGEPTELGIDMQASIPTLTKREERLMKRKAISAKRIARHREAQWS